MLFINDQVAKPFFFKLIKKLKQYDYERQDKTHIRKMESRIL